MAIPRDPKVSWFLLEGSFMQLDQITKLVEEMKDLESENYPKFYEQHKDSFSRIGEFKYWCKHLHEEDFISKMICPCGAKTRFLNSKEGYAKYCSIPCSATYGHQKKTCKLKYSVSNSARPKIKISSKSTNSIHPDLNRNFVKSRFIVDNRFKLHEFIEYFNLSELAAFGYKREFEINELNDVGFEEIQELGDFIEDSGYYCIRGNRNILSEQELDIYVPRKDLGIEYVDLMHHSFGRSEVALFNNSGSELWSKSHHLDKFASCESAGVELLHVWENEWSNPQTKAIWKSMIQDRLGLNAELYLGDLRLARVSNELRNQFLNENHILGACPATDTLGLHLNGEIVFLMLFNKFKKEPRKWSIVRICTKKGYYIEGAEDWILSCFIKSNNDVEEITYHENKRWCRKNSIFKRFKFECLGSTAPAYFYFHQEDKIVYDKLRFQKGKQEWLLKNFDEYLSETENMYNNGYRKIYDCGEKIYRLDLTQLQK